MTTYCHSLFFLPFGNISVDWKPYNHHVIGIKYRFIFKHCDKIWHYNLIQGNNILIFFSFNILHHTRQNFVNHCCLFVYSRSSLFISNYISFWLKISLNLQLHSCYFGITYMYLYAIELSRFVIWNKKH